MVIQKTQTQNNENIEKHITEPFIIRPKWLITSIRKTNRC